MIRESDVIRSNEIAMVVYFLPLSPFLPPSFPPLSLSLCFSFHLPLPTIANYRIHMISRCVCDTHTTDLTRTVFTKSVRLHAKTPCVTNRESVLLLRNALKKHPFKSSGSQHWVVSRIFTQVYKKNELFT